MIVALGNLKKILISNINALRFFFENDTLDQANLCKTHNLKSDQ